MPTLKHWLSANQLNYWLKLTWQTNWNCKMAFRAANCTTWLPKCRPKWAKNLSTLMQTCAWRSSSTTSTNPKRTNSTSGQLTNCCVTKLNTLAGMTKRHSSGTTWRKTRWSASGRVNSSGTKTQTRGSRTNSWNSWCTSSKTVNRSIVCS